MTRTRICQSASYGVLLTWVLRVYLEKQIFLLGGLHHRSATQLHPGLHGKSPYQLVESSSLATALDFIIGDTLLDIRLEPLPVASMTAHVNEDSIDSLRRLESPEHRPLLVLGHEPKTSTTVSWADHHPPSTRPISFADLHSMMKCKRRGWHTPRHFLSLASRRWNPCGRHRIACVHPRLRI